MPSSKTAVKTTTAAAVSKHAKSAHSLDKIASKYHSRMRTVDASSDSLSEGVVVPALREAIVEGVLAPGSRLSEVQVAKQLNVSRTPMREAFAQLEREGLVTVLPRVGAYVRAVTLRDVEEIYTVRAALECLAVQLASERITALGSAQLDDVIEAMRMSVDADDPAGYVDALDRFYAIVMTIADNRTLQESHAGLIGPVRRLRRIAMARGGRMQASFSQTVRIRDAIVNQLPNVQDLMREQLDGACRAALDVLNDAGDSSDKN
ncbi:GntR family transcriptional regulator [Paraburkholderia phytofirmans]|jgi:DNA-binding GntR family transcriptional regulator|uniref:GntR family transcriptional regulator n=1 Tax=Paraburkholderia sp. BL9I2N2 TaxID=1938809 RepID=UPI0010476208|nr:GntR family transcriptional regulator [Paraburkholderia sp. BL9I2N2]TCK91842.1 GntR family transcriptional regulator [Paraburkholderia sp. BL9I2N2]